MRKMMNTLYITSPDSYLGLDGETIIVKREDLDDIRIPLHNIESVLAFGYTGASPALMGALAERNISLCFLTQNGRFLSRIIGESHGNILLRKEQYRISDDEPRSLEIAKQIISAKIHNSRWIIERAIRDYPLRLDIEKLKNRSLYLQDMISQAQSSKSLEELRGIEGKSASSYFGVFDDLILQQKDHFFFKSRSRRPPLDNMNAMLSFGYTLLANDTAAALESVGLDAYAGFLHRDRPGRISLALDIMEEFRGPLVERMVISMINKKVVSGKGFIKEESGGIIMTKDTRDIFLKTWQERKKEIITHPFLKEKMEWGLVPYAQALLLARFIRKDLDAYPVFLWK
jgi:CRISPR-associated protein Cas1